jgi:hypothetical protein
VSRSDKIEKAAQAIGVVASVVPVATKAVGWIRKIVQRIKARRAARRAGKNKAFDAAVARELANEGMDLADEVTNAVRKVKKSGKGLR